tara:strand:+ start:149 stop:1207 length:1059 start_codon:yes stop_codon:yes gene_type:complete
MLNKYFKKSKAIPIDKFVENVLYDKKYGYYAKKNPFGKNGDFITSPDITFLFSEMIAIWIIYFWEKLDKPKKFNIVELGPGTGKLSKILLETFKKFPEFYKSQNTFLYERSKKLKLVQKKILLGSNIKWISNFKKIKEGPVIFFGNEFFDAIPVKQFEMKGKHIYERHVEKTKNNSIKIILKRVSKKDLRILNSFKFLKKKNIVEFPKMGFKELDPIIKKIKKLSGGILLIDYGFIKNSNESTLQSVKAHKKNKLFNNIGKADITSLVNFNLLKEYFFKNNLGVNKITTQGSFLKKIGILNRAEILSKKMNFKEKSDLYFRLQRILSPKQMGELFKVVFAYKNKKKISIGFS